MRFRAVAIVVVLLAKAEVCLAIEPADVLVIANKTMPGSVDVAEHYRNKRGVPKENVLILDLPTTEDISRSDYDTKLIVPLRAALKSRRDRIKVLLCVYGVPLRVGPKQPDEKDKPELAKVQTELSLLQERLKQQQGRSKELEPEAKADSKGASAKELAKVKEEVTKLDRQRQTLENRRRWLSQSESVASVDSELMLLWWDDYELRRFIVNPLHFQFPEGERKKKPPVLLTARLDGPSPDLAKRLVDDAIAVEKTGLVGKVYVDARNIRYDAKSDSGYGYGAYDESMREMAALLKDKAKLDVTLDNQSAVFPPGSCPECALYCGWYSHANFVDSCKFVKGAVAWHLASSEAVSLRRKDQNLWCRNILEKGAAATLGPVAEPYTLGFPKPAEFFGFLGTGEFTLVECYGRTLNVVSWMGTLVGDPLYNPFRAVPRLKSAQIQPSPLGGRFLIQAR